MIKLRQVELPIFTNGQSLRILHLSDLHLTPKQKNKIADLKKLSSLDPDLTIVTGDFLAHQDSVPAVIAALGSLLSKPGFLSSVQMIISPPQLKIHFHIYFLTAAAVGWE